MYCATNSNERIDGTPLAVYPNLVCLYYSTFSQMHDISSILRSPASPTLLVDLTELRSVYGVIEISMHVFCKPAFIKTTYSRALISFLENRLKIDTTMIFSGITSTQKNHRFYVRLVLGNSLQRAMMMLATLLIPQLN